MLVPEVAAGAAGQLDGLRAACDEAVRRLSAADPQGLLVVGAAQETRLPFALDHSSLGPWGLDLDVFLGTAAKVPQLEPELPLATTVGAWLLARNPIDVETAAVTVSADSFAAACADLGRDVCATWRDRVALLVLGDGSSCRSETAPGYFDPRGEAFDRTVAAALAHADLTALAGLDDGLARTLGVAGVAPWRVLAGAAAGRRWRAELLYDDAPYGVGYFVASWMAA